MVPLGGDFAACNRMANNVASEFVSFSARLSAAENHFSIFSTSDWDNYLGKSAV
jgi:hypothetical protein